jgi:hypothetical protein
MRHELWSDRCGSLLKVAHERRGAADRANIARLPELLQ